jgi:hypothetical protein
MEPPSYILLNTLTRSDIAHFSNFVRDRISVGVQTATPLSALTQTTAAMPEPMIS